MKRARELLKFQPFPKEAAQPPPRARLAKFPEAFGSKFPYGNSANGVAEFLSMLHLRHPQGSEWQPLFG